MVKEDLVDYFTNYLSKELAITEDSKIKTIRLAISEVERSTRLNCVNKMGILAATKEQGSD